MTYNATIDLGNISPNITHVSLFTCDENCDNCSPIQYYQHVPIGFFPLQLNNIDESITHISVVVDGGDCDGMSQCLKLIN